MSHIHIPDGLIQSVLAYMFRLVNDSHITPIYPIKTFYPSYIQDAFAFVRSGQHMEGFAEDWQFTLAKRGAKKLAVLSRLGFKDSRSQDVIANCHSLGCIVKEFVGDVTSPADVQRAFTSTKPAIRGIHIIQGPMVLQDKPYELMSFDDFHTTLASKVTGTWNLHNVAMELGLTFGFFTIVSSMSGVIGQRGQGNYAAANVFMDSFARYRQSLGLAANSIDLGAVAGVGYIAQQGRMEHHFGWNQRMKINERRLGEILEASTLQQTSAMNPQTVSQLLTFISRSQPTQTCKEIVAFSCLSTKTAIMTIQERKQLFRRAQGVLRQQP
ncbi:hypothetical protein ETB97_004827 [Aspergillus alliaceus]|uniref:Ketoreductase domain-containing protein n=1 Tax=Petromyces alliaceus TaxID=209559 RepID=A0A8H6EA70_PETAA|nr:hypothetical protein ETB97_004827 [Aspergillus burnettii]